jgi:hypothetical protein
MVMVMVMVTARATERPRDDASSPPSPSSCDAAVAGAAWDLRLAATKDSMRSAKSEKNGRNASYANCVNLKHATSATSAIRDCYERHGRSATQCHDQYAAPVAESPSARCGRACPQA